MEIILADTKEFITRDQKYLQVRKTIIKKIGNRHKRIVIRYKTNQIQWETWNCVRLQSHRLMIPRWAHWKSLSYSGSTLNRSRALMVQDLQHVTTSVWLPEQKFSNEAMFRRTATIVTCGVMSSQIIPLQGRVVNQIRMCEWVLQTIWDIYVSWIDCNGR